MAGLYSLVGMIIIRPCSCSKACDHGINFQYPGLQLSSDVFFLTCFSFLYTIVAGYYSFTLVVCESVVRPSVRFSFPDDNLSNHQWIFTKLGMCIDIVEIRFGIANGQISSIFDGVICPRHAHIFVSGL